MRFYKNDPIVNVLHTKIETLKNQHFLEDHLISTIEDNLLENNGLDALSYAYKYISDYPNSVRASLTFYDTLKKLSFHYDAGQYIEQVFLKKNIRGDNDPHALVFRRYFQHLISQGFVSKAVSTALSHYNIVIKHDFIKKMVGGILKSYRFDDLWYALFYKEKEGNDEDLKRGYSVVDLVSAIAINDKKLIKEVSWNLFGAGERSEFFFKNVISVNEVDHPLSKFSIHFVSEAYYAYPDNLYFLYRYCQQRVALGDPESSSYILKSINLTSILINCNHPYSLREDLYYLYLQVSAWTGYDSETLLAHQEAVNSNLLNPYYLDMTKTLSLRKKSGEEIGQRNSQIPISTLSLINKIINSLNIDNIDSKKGLQIILTGQVRGEKELLNYVTELSAKLSPEQVIIETWDKQSVIPPRMNSISRLFKKEIFLTLPAKYREGTLLQKKFPSFFEKIANNSKIPLQIEEEIGLKKHFYIENEQEFDNYIVREYPTLKLKGNFNQAKMFYKIGKVRNSCNASSVVVRSRVDITPDFNIRLEDYINAATIDENVIYTNYRSNYGNMGDQFWVGSGKSISDMCSIWELAKYAGKLAYADFFNIRAKQHAAEALCLQHAIVCGLNIRSTSSLSIVNFTKPDFFEYVPLKVELMADYEELLENEKKLLEEFYVKTLEVSQ